MKTGLCSIAILAFVATASSLDIRKQSALDDSCNIGYCTQNGGTTGGAGGQTVNVSSVDQLLKAVKGDEPAVVLIRGTLVGPAKIRVGSNKSVIGAQGSSLTNIGLYVNKQKNVILRNLKISKVEAGQGDAIGVQKSNNVWIDHCELSSDQDHGKDYYDGLVDITHAADWVTVSNTYLHDHYKTSLVGHSDKNADEDTGHLHVTYAGNHWNNVNSRNPSIRFGTGHIFNNYYHDVEGSGANPRMGAQLLIESTVFEKCAKKAIASEFSSQPGYAVVRDVDLGESSNSAAGGSLTSVPYDYKLLGAANVKESVIATAGQTLTF